MAKKDAYKDQVIGPTFEAGKPSEADRWRAKLPSRADMLKYLKNSERYWCLPPEEWYGSEKRKSKA